METSIELILKERKRQIEIEGYDADHEVREVTQWMEAPEPPNKSNSTPTPINEDKK